MHASTHRSISLLPLVLCALACTGEVSAGESLAGTSIELYGDASGLRLATAPRDADYTAFYPNPERVEHMRVTVGAGGRLQLTCAAAGRSLDCTESPFFSERHMLPSGKLQVRIWDVFGEIVAEGTVQAVQAAPGEEGYTPAPEFGDDGDREAPDGDVPSYGDECVRPEAKRRFCDLVNARIADHGIDYTLDCESLPDSFEIPDLDRDLRREDTPLRRCGDVLDEPEDQLEDELDDDFCGELLVDRWEDNARQKLIRDGICRTSPLLLDLDGDGIRLGSLTDGVPFDLLAEGRPVRAAWPEAHGDAFLFLDRSGNGLADDASELFGDVTAGQVFADGFAALATLDSNQDGAVDATDRRFADLRLWRDDGDGRCAPTEVLSLAEADIRALALDPRRTDRVDEHGNTIPLVSHFVWADGRPGTLVDAYLRYQPLVEKAEERAPRDVFPPRGEAKPMCAP